MLQEARTNPALTTKRVAYGIGVEHVLHSEGILERTQAMCRGPLDLFWPCAKASNELGWPFVGRLQHDAAPFAMDDDLLLVARKPARLGQSNRLAPAVLEQFGSSGHERKYRQTSILVQLTAAGTGTRPASTGFRLNNETHVHPRTPSVKSSVGKALQTRASAASVWSPAEAERTVRSERLAFGGCNVSYAVPSDVNVQRKRSLKSLTQASQIHRYSSGVE